MKFVMASLLALFIALFSQICFATVNTANVVSLNTATTNVTTGAYITLIASSPIPTGQIVLVNNTSSQIKVAIGASGSEVDFVSVGPTTTLLLPVKFAAGIRVSVEAVDSTASSKYISVSLNP